MIIENQTLFDEAASFALDENLFELQDILTSFSCYSAQITCLNTEQQQPFFETGQKLQESLLNFADRIALGQGAIDLKPTLVEFKNACTELELAIQQNAVNAESITPDISQTQDLEAQALHIEPLTSDIVDKHLEADDVDDDIMSVFQEELSDILSSIDLQLTKLLQEEATLTNLQELQRDYHTIKGGANYIHEHFIAEMAKEADLICERFIDARKLPTQDVLSLLKLTQNLFQDRLRKLPTVLPLSDIESSILEDLRRAKPAAPVHADTEYQPQEYQPQEQPHQDELQQDALNDSVKANDQDIEQTIEPLVLQTRDGFEYKEVTLDRATFTLNEKNVDIVEIFLEEADELLEELAAINSHLTGQDQQINLESLSSSTLRIIHTLKGGARLAGIDIIGDTANRFEKQLEKTDPRLLTDYAPVLDKFRLNVKDIVADIGQLLKFDPPGDSESVTIETIPVLIDANTTAEQFEFNENLAQASTEDVVNVSAEGKNHSTVPIHNPQALSPTTAQSTETLEEYDPEILEIFFEESKELAEELEKAVGQITDQKIDEAIMDQLKRILHTVKGSARLAGFSEFGNQAHLFESRLESLQTPTTEAETAEVITLNDGLFASLQHTLKSIEDHLKQDTVPDVPVVASANTVLVQPKPRQKPAKRKKNTEVVRIGAELLEKLVNLAGETVISRSSVQQELLGFNRIIDDFGLTLDRIRDQIRNFETETESRMISSSYSHHAQVNQSHNQGYNQTFNQVSQNAPEYHDFDTLEMDRFSSFHQLARSLSESASDLINMKDSMLDKVRTTESLVLQQSRIQTQLHEGLMQSRMVPFSRLAPRLTRMVRQIATELGKKAELNIVNAEGEMDRSVLERMIPPLEHMLRNSLDHGVEKPEIRLKLGKSEVGQITLNLSREGNEIMLRLSDDGAGIDPEKIREKAIAQGLLSEQAQLTEKEILQFIFKPGFSTATQVTQISGRGVGMDIVFSEIKQLNGSLQLQAAPGLGTQFTIRLPFTVSMSRALMVKVHEETYAIPLTHIEGVVRVSPYELSAIYDSPDRLFSYAEKQYEVQYLGNYLHMKGCEQDLKDSVPLLLARNTERSVAVQVDALIGSKEIVVKSTGPQLSQVTGLSGATILGDGSVIIILDLNSLIRDDMANNQPNDQNLDLISPTLDMSTSINPLVMVVDDSVTVRKVTSRLLERHGMDVITAKDGIDAVTQLRDTTPSLILLDIEMPRMDGFEVASHIRHDPRLAGIPIIMISSRTGDKHRTRASALGVNAFLGKPYQELQLMEKINELVPK